MTDDPNVNPYEPPDETSQADAGASFSAAKPKRREIDRVLMFVLPIATAFWVFVAGAAIYELVSMPEDAYGPNRPLFRRSYYWTLAKGVVMSAICLSAYIAVHRASPYARSVGTTAVVVSVLFLVFLL